MPPVSNPRAPLQTSPSPELDHATAAAGAETNRSSVRFIPPCKKRCLQIEQRFHCCEKRSAINFWLLHI
jgi:hypothetical protein